MTRRDGLAFGLVLVVAVLAEGLLAIRPLWLGAGTLFGLVGVAGWLVMGERR